jgi:drug/metabolite transporter (DMT)-like permease
MLEGVDAAIGSGGARGVRRVSPPPARGAMLRMIAGAALISTTSVFVRLAHVAPTVSAFYRMAFGGVMLLFVLVLGRRWRGYALSDLRALCVPALAFAADLMLWHRSIRAIGPGLATLVANFQVFIMALVGVVAYRERLPLRFVLGLTLASIGLWLLVGVRWGAFSPEFRIGVGFGLLTGVAYAVYLLSLRHAQLRRVGLDPARAMCLNSVLAAAILALAVAVEGDGFAIPDTQSWASLLALGLFGQVLGWVLIAQAMPFLPASLVGFLLLLQPALSFVLDVILFARPTTDRDWIGLALSLFGIFLGSTRSRAAPRAKSG